MGLLLFFKNNESRLKWWKVYSERVFVFSKCMLWKLEFLYYFLITSFVLFILCSELFHKNEC
jgi:hypothetical protein